MSAAPDLNPVQPNKQQTSKNKQQSHNNTLFPKTNPNNQKNVTPNKSCNNGNSDAPVALSNQSTHNDTSANSASNPNSAATTKTETNNSDSGTANSSMTTYITDNNSKASTNAYSADTPVTISSASTTNNSSLGTSESITTSNDGHRTQNLENLSKTNLYIRGLQTNTTDQDLYEMCCRFGQIVSTKAIIDQTSGCCRGYGFVEFTSSQSAYLAVQELTKSGVQAQMAKISSLHSSHHHHHHHHHHNNHHNNNHHHHQTHNNQNNSSNNNTSRNNGSNHQRNHNSSNNNDDPTNLYIANLPPNMSEQELEHLLSTYGAVVSTRILRDQSNIPRGVGFARMESRDKCQQIIEELSGRPYKGWKEPLLIKFAVGGNKKRHHHNNQYQHHNNNHQHHKIHHEETRWRAESGNNNDLADASSFDHQGNISHSNHLTDLTMMSSMGYPRMPGYPPTVAPGGAYPPPMVPPTSGPQWLHPAGAVQPYVIPQQMIQAGGLSPPNQVTAAALHYGHIPQLTSQMQGLQIGHLGDPVCRYLPTQHQWSAVWTHPITQQQQPPPLPSDLSMRVTAPLQQPPTSNQQQQSPQPATAQPSSNTQQH